jgi:hypothetical protein
MEFFPNMREMGSVEFHLPPTPPLLRAIAKQASRIQKKESVIIKTIHFPQLISQAKEVMKVKLLW